MSEATQSRPDVDIHADIQHLETQYPPLVNDRHKVDFTVQDGVVTVSGYVKTVPTYNYLLNNLAQIPGVKQVIADNFYSDEGIRRHAGGAVPFGVQVRVEYGAIVLTGDLPEDTTVETVVDNLRMVQGVRRVVTAF